MTEKLDKITEQVKQMQNGLSCDNHVFSPQDVLDRNQKFIDFYNKFKK
jgi:hypothetical protein